jgi:hypothetical protein
MIISNTYLKRMWKEEFKVLSQCFPGGTEEYHEKLKSWFSGL